MLSRFVMIIAGLCFSTGLVYAQGNANSSNPYLTEMQQTLNKANAKAMSDFNKQYPQPTPSTVETKQSNQPSVTPKTSTPPSSPNPPSTVTHQPPPDIAVTEQKKDEKKDGAVNIFASPGSSSSDNNETKDQNQGTPNIFR